MPEAVRQVIEVVPAPIKAALAAMGLFALIAGLGAAFNALRARRLRRQHSDLMEEVGVLQTALLPDVPARLGALWVSAAYRPADGPSAGGNFYDAFALQGGSVGVLIGEISGQGRERLGESMLVRHALRTHLKAGLEPADALGQIRAGLESELTGELRAVVVAIHDPHAATLTYARLGESAPLIVPTGDDAAFDPTDEGTGDARQVSIQLPDGARACLFTTGLTEARLNGSRLGRDGVSEIVSELRGDLTAEALLEAVAARTRSVPSDMAACVLEADDDPALRGDEPGHAAEPQALRA